MASDAMTVRLHLPQIRVLGVVEDTPGALRVSVESTLLRLRCPQCGFRCHRVHDCRDKKVRDLEVSGRRTVLVWSRRRMVCDNCDSRFLEDHPAFEGALTGRLARRLVADAKVMTFRRGGAPPRCALARVCAPWWTSWSALVAERRRSRRCSVLLVDETSMRKRHRYVTVIVNGDTGRTLAMVEHRNAAALSAFLMQQGHRWCKGVKVVVSDGSRAYKAAIDAHLGHARHVLDRFHVIRWFAAGLTQVRRDVQRREPTGVKPAFDPEVFRGPVRAAAQRRHPHRHRPRPPRQAVRRPPPPQSRLAGPCRSSTASTPPTTMTAPWKPSGGSATSTRPASCPSTTTPSTRSSHGPTRSSTGTTPTGLQRQNRGHQQPAPSAAPHRPRLHQPTQLRSPRHPRDIITPTRCQQPSIPHLREGPGRASAAAIAPSKLRSASVSSGRSIWRRSTASWWRNTMISRSFERPERTVSQASDARNRYKIRYTRTQHRPASRQVNDHGRVSGTHTLTAAPGWEIYNNNGWHRCATIIDPPWPQDPSMLLSQTGMSLADRCASYCPRTSSSKPARRVSPTCSPNRSDSATTATPGPSTSRTARHSRRGRTVPGPRIWQRNGWSTTTISPNSITRQVLTPTDGGERDQRRDTV